MRSYLIVDDNVDFADNMAEIIADGVDAQAVVAASGERALALVRERRFDALLTDMRMPVMSGARLVHNVRRVDPGLPAIVMTAYTADDDLEGARHEGLLAVLPKPVPIPRLIDLLSVARRDGLVALVEDDASMADNLSEILCSRGFAAVTARSVVDTERLGEVRPFCALVDLRVQGGHDGAAMCRLADKFPGLPMLVVTAFQDVPPPRPHRGLFVKPFDSGALLTAVEQLYASRST
jgi:DNA-binding NtrC family response regulator